MSREPFLRRIFPCTVATLGQVESWFRGLLTEKGVDEGTAGDILYCLNEALLNALDHGSQFRSDREVVVEYRFEPDRVTLILTDAGGRAFDPAYFRDLAVRKDWGAGGRGILIMQELMDEVGFFFVPGHSTSVMLVKALGAAGA
ncbi:MAG: ATP-binding protein [Candidatus Riflebacteria bacterium]|nr:ATP-binding protein [Candidatus Riflebacteria bacterium]